MGEQKVKYPESDKMKAVSEQSQLCGEFLEWLISKYYLIGKDEVFEQSHIPVGYSSFVKIDKLLAEYFDIDLNEIEKERQQILKELRSNKSTKELIWRGIDLKYKPDENNGLPAICHDCSTLNVFDGIRYVDDAVGKCAIHGCNNDAELIFNPSEYK